MKSVQGQTYPEIEHVIQDGGSTDGTLDIVEKLGNDRTTLFSVPDKGIYDAINKGIANASGEVIGLMHSDDFFADPNVISDIAEIFSNPDIDGVYGDLDYVSATDETRVVRHWRSGEFSMQKLRRGWMPPHPTVYLRRSVFEEFGAYDAQFRIAADYDAMLRYFGSGQLRIAYLPRVLVKMRLGGESNRSLGRIITKSKEDLFVIRRNGVGGLGTLTMKNLQKIGQFIVRS